MKKIMKKDGLLKTLKTVTAAVMSAALLTTAQPVFAGGTNIRMNVRGSWVPTAVPNVLAYQLPDGSFLQDGFTIDGYYVNKDGFWASAYNILGAWVPARNSWLAADQAGEFETVIPILKNAQKKLTKDLHGWRVISVYSNHITLSSVVTSEKQRKKTTRLAMYKNPSFNGYTIQVCTPLSGDEHEMTEDAGEWTSMALYDYQVLRLLCFCVSRSGDKLARAIYSSWDDTNSENLKVNEWVGVGDTMVRYVPSQGAGLYEIKAIF